MFRFKQEQATPSISTGFCVALTWENGTSCQSWINQRPVPNPARVSSRYFFFPPPVTFSPLSVFNGEVFFFFSSKKKTCMVILSNASASLCPNIRRWTRVRAAWQTDDVTSRVNKRIRYKRETLQGNDRFLTVRAPNVRKN